MSSSMADRSKRAWVLSVAPDEVPVVPLIGQWWRQTDPTYDALDLPPLARTAGRCHRKAEPAVLYASSSNNAAWGELFRHVHAEVSPFEVMRTMSALNVTDLPVVDFDDPMIRALFEVSERQLTSNNYAPCRRIMDLLRLGSDRFGGCVLPSAAVPGEQTLVVFKNWISDHLGVLD
jgi:hypothetical protein